MSLRDLIKNLRGIVQTTAIDVGHHTVKLAQIEHRRGRMSLQRVDYLMLEQDTIKDNEIRNRESLIKTLQELVVRSFPDGEIAGEVVVGLNWSNSILADRLTVNGPNATDEEFILGEAQKRPPFDEDGVNIDFTLIGESAQQNGKEYLVVAAKEAVLNNWANVFKEAGINPTIIDVDALAVVNSFVNTATPQQLDGMVGLVTIGDRRSHISFVLNGRYLSTRLLQSGAIEGLVIKIAQRTQLDKAVVLKIIQGKEQAPDQMTFFKALKVAIDDLVSLIETSLRYASQQSVSALYLTGGGASLQGLPEAIRGRLSIEATFLNPLDSDKISLNNGMFAKESASQDEINILVPVIGMAMRTRP